MSKDSPVPFKGVRLILKNLVRKFRGVGGELKLRRGVAKIKVDNERAVGVVLDNGEEIEGKRILSSVGRLETLRLCDDVSEVDQRQSGQLTFIESISILDREPKKLGNDRTIVFYNDSEKFHWQRPDNDLCDIRTGVVCSPNNYEYSADDGNLDDGVIRITTIADFDRWNGLDEKQYKLAKLDWYDKSVESAVRYVPDFRNHVVDTDVFSTYHDSQIYLAR